MMWASERNVPHCAYEQDMSHGEIIWKNMVGINGNKMVNDDKPV